MTLPTYESLFDEAGLPNRYLFGRYASAWFDCLVVDPLFTFEPGEPEYKLASEMWNAAKHHYSRENDAPLARNNRGMAEFAAFFGCLDAPVEDTLPTFHNRFTGRQLAWIEALEDGTYHQTDGTLTRYDHDKESDAFCCLGVAAMCVAPRKALNSHMPSQLPEPVPTKITAFFSLYDADANTPLSEQKRYQDDARTSLPDIFSPSLMNDAGLPFPEIAAFLRGLPGLYFTNFDPPKLADIFAFPGYNHYEDDR